MLTTFKHLKETNDIRMSNLPEDVDFLHYLLSAIRVLHVCFVNRLNCYITSSQFVDAKHNLSECAFTNHLNKFVVFQRGLGHLSVLF